MNPKEAKDEIIRMAKEMAAEIVRLRDSYEQLRGDCDLQARGWNIASDRYRTAEAALESTTRERDGLIAAAADAKAIEGVIRDHFYPGPVAGSTQRLVEGLREHFRSALALGDISSLRAQEARPPFASQPTSEAGEEG